MKRKSIWTFVLAFCCFISTMFMLTACNGNKNNKINSIETKSGIVASGEFNKGDTLVCNSVDSTSQEGQSAITKINGLNYNIKKPVYVFDIHITNKNVKVQPNGKVKITMPAPSESTLGFVTFHIKSNNVVEILETSYVDGKISFEIESFSFFLVAEKGQKHNFKAQVDGVGGKIFYASEDKGALFRCDLLEDETITLKASTNAGYEFAGWFNNDGTLISTNEEYTFTMGTSDKNVVAKFNKRITSLFIDQSNINYTIGDEQPNIDNIIVKGVKPNGTKINLTKDVDYTIEKGNLDFSIENTYVVTFTLIEDSTIKASISITVVAPRYVFTATAETGGKILYNNLEQTNSFTTQLKETQTITLKVSTNAGYEFAGWFNNDGTLISTNEEYTFTMGTSDKNVVAKFNELPAELVTLQVNVGNSGLNASGKTLKHKGATERDLNLNNVVVKGVLSDNSSITMTKDTDYTIDLGELDLNTLGTYTITFKSIANTNIKQTFEIEVKEYVVEYKYLENGYGECLNKEYDGGALFVASNAIIINGKSLREINDVVALGSAADQDLLTICQGLKNKVSYKWVKKGTNIEVQPANDVTMPGKSYAYNRRAVGDELVGPAIAGEYEFIFSFEIDGIQTEQFRREGKVTERKFKKIMSADEFTTDTGGIGLFASLRYYTIVGIVDGRPYVMQMPKDILETNSLENVEALARLASSDGYEGILLGNSYDTVFTKYYYNSLVKRYYPATGSDQTQLWEFGTGHYGTRLEKYSASFAYDLFGTGTMRLSGNKIVRSLAVNISGNEGEDTGLMFKFAEDGSVTIYSPYLDNENCALRLVKNADGTFAFTGKDKTTDTRESYKIYIYSYYVPITEQYEFIGDKSQLQKEYDGKPITFNAYKDFMIFNDEISSIGGLIKNEMHGNNGGQYRFAYSNIDDGKGGKGGKDEVLFEMTVTPDGTITGPSSIGYYMLYFQKLVVEKDGSTYWQTMGYGPICTFEIYTTSA